MGKDLTAMFLVLEHILGSVCRYSEKFVDGGVVSRWHYNMVSGQWL